jgi:hypothetical protein
MFGKALMDVQRQELLALLDRYIRDGTRRINWLTTQDAVRSIQFILTHFVRDGRLLHSFKGGPAKLAGYLGDSALHLIQAPRRISQECNIMGYYKSFPSSAALLCIRVVGLTVYTTQAVPQGKIISAVSSPPGSSQPATFSDPLAYCTALGTIDAPDSCYTGPQAPEAVAQGVKKAFGAQRMRHSHRSRPTLPGAV